MVMAEDWPGPFLQMATFCDRIITDADDGTMSIIRVIDTYTIRNNFPDELPEGKERGIITRMALMFRSGEYTGDAEVAIILVRPDGSEEPLPKAVYPFAGGTNGINVKVDLRLVIRQEGAHWFQIRVNGRLLTRVPLRIVFDRPVPNTDQRTQGREMGAIVEP